MKARRRKQFNKLVKTNLEIAVDDARDHRMEHKPRKTRTTRQVESASPMLVNKEQCEPFNSKNKQSYMHGSMSKKECKRLQLGGNSAMSRCPKP